MHCKHHHEAEARFICEKCKQPICEACAIEIGSNKVCQNCAHEALFAQSPADIPHPPKTYTRPEVQGGGNWLESFIFFCFATIPGAGQMYTGLFKRGLQLMVTFIAGIVLFSYINLDSWMPLIIVPTWFFSFFDAYHNRRAKRRGETVEDAPVYDYDILGGNKKYLGTALLVLGIIGLINAWTINGGMLGKILGIDLHSFSWLLQRSIFPITLIAIGVMIVRKARADKEQTA